MQIPVATYRIQFNPDFDFKKAREIIPYLAMLGISHLYASPIFKARNGSTHGYDIVDQNKLNPELGSEEDFNALIKTVKSYNLLWLQDIVPNHMAYSHENQWLMDILESGHNSPYFNFFDIDWEHPCKKLNKRLLAPFLGKPYLKAIEDSEIYLSYNDNGIAVNYYELKFPLKISTYTFILTYRIASLKKRIGEKHTDFIKYLGIIDLLNDIQHIKNKRTYKNGIIKIKRLLWELYNKNNKLKYFIDENIAIFNGKKGESTSFKLLDRLLVKQLFCLDFFKVSTKKINYRRFFNINDLISLNIENDEVFDRSHSFIIKLVKENKFNGLRVDHIDGLYDPAKYLDLLHKKIGGAYIVVEKILDINENIPFIWPIHGTTGYDFLNYVNSLFCDMKNKKIFNDIYKEFICKEINYEKSVRDMKDFIIEKHMKGDLDNLERLTYNIAQKHFYHLQISHDGLTKAMREITAHFSVYRSYINSDQFSENDRITIKETINKAIKNNPDLLHEINIVKDILLLNIPGDISVKDKAEWLHMIMKFQQFTGPVMAKGFEDTFLYIFNRCLSLNEVGGYPDYFGITTENFHDFLKKRLVNSPHTLNTTSTHDTKRGEDMRARLNVLSEIPDEWEDHIKNWSRLNKSKKELSQNGISVPDNNDEYFLYQTLVGAFQFEESEYHYFVERIKNYIIKAIREAKINTTWLNPGTDYEEKFLSFIDKILEPSEKNSFLKIFRPFQKKIAFYGTFNSLSQTLLKITSPGIPDFYQGTELWDLNLVDPDNRRPVNFKERDFFLKQINNKDILDNIKEIIDCRKDGRIKLFLIQKALQARGQNHSLFRNGQYLPLDVKGKYKDNIIAFGRYYEHKWSITIIPRFTTKIFKYDKWPYDIDIWEDTLVILPENTPKILKDVITSQLMRADKVIYINKALRYFPVALFIGDGKK